MKCVIMGAFGFLGSHLAEVLLERGHTVRLFDRFEASRANVLHLLGRVELAVGDFGNAAAVSEAMIGCDAVYHLVSTTHPKVSNDDPAFDVASNLLPTIHMLDQARLQGVKKIVFFSSGGTVYGLPRRTPITEDHATDPLCSYGIHKLAIEKYLHLYHHLYGLDYGVLRFSNPFGERQRPDHAQGAIAVFTHRVLAGEAIEVWGDGKVVRDYLYVRDAMDAAERVLRCDSAVKVFNVSSGRGISLLEVIDEISRAVGHPAKVVFGPARKLDVPVNVLDSSVANRILGWTPTHTFKQGLDRMVAYLRQVEPE